MTVKTFGYPKQGWKKRRKHHKESILQRKDGTCWLCRVLHGSGELYGYTEEHHVFFGSGQRWKSEEDGLKVYLCVQHHRTGPESVHRNHKICRMLQAAAQEVYEKEHTREEFMDRYGKNYITREDELNENHA